MGAVSYPNHIVPGKASYAVLLVKIGCVFLTLYGILPLLNPYLYSICIGKGVLTRRVSKAFILVMDPGGYGGEKRT